MAVKLMDIENSPKVVEFGTCDLCFSTGTVTEPVFVFEDSVTGETRRIEGYYWSWGNYFDVYIDNVIDFANWVNQKENLSINDLNDFSDLQNLVYQYDNSNYDDEEEDD